MQLVQPQNAEEWLNLYSDGPRVWKFASHDNPKWEGKIERHSPGRYSLTTNGEQIGGHEMMAFVNQYQIISFGGRQ